MLIQIPEPCQPIPIKPHWSTVSCKVTKTADGMALPSFRRRISGSCTSTYRAYRASSEAQNPRLSAGGCAVIDGVYGTGTRSAIMQWQTSADLEPTGLLSDTDAARLLSSTTAASVMAPSESTFVCPESLPDDIARAKAWVEFLAWLKTAYPELDTEAKITSLRYKLLVAHHCTQTLANIAQHASVVPNAALIYQTALRFRHDLHAGGTSLVAVSVRNCYFNAGVDPDKLKPCMLYDSAAFRMDSDIETYMKMQGVPNWQRSPYFTNELYSQRAATYTRLVFKSADEVKAYLVQPSLRVLNEAVNFRK